MFFFCSIRVKRRDEPNAFCAQACARPLRSGDDIGRDLVFDEGDAVAQL